MNQKQWLVFMLALTLAAGAWGCGNNDNGGGGGDADADADGDSDGDADADSDADTDTDSDTDSDTDTDSDSGTDSDTDTETGTDTDTGTGADTDTDTDTDSDPGFSIWCDDSSGFCWQDPSPDGTMDWSMAIHYCNALHLDGHSDWRLPSISELRSLVRGCPYTVTGGSCEVTDDCAEVDCWSGSCNSCNFNWGPGPGGCYWDPALGGACIWYWSSTPVADVDAWYVRFSYGWIMPQSQTSSRGVRCVRDET